MTSQNQTQHPFLSLHRQSDSDLHRDAQTETPEYLVPVLAAYDDPNEAALRERATILYCQGHRTADIAARLAVSVSTVKSWLIDARYLLASELRVSREEQQLRAIESARALATEAWLAYERDCDLQRAILAGEYDYLRRRITRPDHSSHRPPATSAPPTLVAPASRRPLPADHLNDHGEASGWTPVAPVAPHASDDSGAETTSDLLYEEFERPRYSSQAARLLSVALAAQREVARLQGLYEHVPPPPQPVDFHIFGPTPEPPTPAASGPAERACPPEINEAAPASSPLDAREAADTTSVPEAPQPPPANGDDGQPVGAGAHDEKDDDQGTPLETVSPTSPPGIHLNTAGESDRAGGVLVSRANHSTSGAG